MATRCPGSHCSPRGNPTVLDRNSHNCAQYSPRALRVLFRGRSYYKEPLDPLPHASVQKGASKAQEIATYSSSSCTLNLAKKFVIHIRLLPPPALALEVLTLGKASLQSHFSRHDYAPPVCRYGPGHPWNRRPLHQRAVLQSYSGDLLPSRGPNRK